MPQIPPMPTSPRSLPAAACTHSRRHGAWVLAAVAAAAANAAGGATARMPDPVVITASGNERRILETPYAVSVVSADELRAAGPMLNLSEALSRVPGIVANNRNNYAQDLQINSRGFGARASFGVRGLRLYSDGIPASGPDGQGQVSHFDLAGAQRLEVLRGPFTALYGSSSGGVISLVSAAPSERRIGLALDAGSDGLQQWRVTLDGPVDGGLSIRAQLSRMDVDGPRLHSAAQRTLGNVRLGWEREADRVVLVINSLKQPALDPLGLTRSQLQADPTQTTAVALPQDAPGQADRFNTRKDTAQDQAGVSWRHRFSGGALAQSQVAAYSGRRSVTQWQAIPVAAQFNASNPALTERQPGGVIDFDRRYQGLDARLVWRWPLADERRLQVVAGVAAESSVEDRRGFENFTGNPAVRLLGVTGQLRRNESNRISARDVYAQAEAELAPQWAATLGLRSGRVAFDSRDRYVVGPNGDDSGSLRYRYSNPVAAIQWRPDESLNVYLSAGRGFESPTLGELAYRPDGNTGFNTELLAQTSRQVEFGSKWRRDGLALDAALFQASTANEIGIASNRGGRSTFRNVGRTERRGAELALTVPLAQNWRAQISATWLNATYRDGFAVCAALPCLTPTVPVPAGNRIAGTLQHLGYAELAWTAPKPAGQGPTLELALEVRGQGRLPVNDVNSDFAAGFGLLALRARWQLALPVGRVDLLARAENLADRRVAGSVIVGEGNGRFFEPTPGRGWLLSARYSAPF